MVTIDATTVKNKFGETIDRARTEPVMVTRSGRKAVVIISAEEYEELQALEDAYWSRRAIEAEARGSFGPEKSAELLGELMRKNGMQVPDSLEANA